MAVEPVSSVEEFRRVSPFRRAWVLFWAYVRITSLVIGGGYAIIAAAQDEFVRRRKWLTEDDVLEMITITQTVPGILAPIRRFTSAGGSAATPARSPRWSVRFCRLWSSSC